MIEERRRGIFTSTDAGDTFSGRDRASPGEGGLLIQIGKSHGLTEKGRAMSPYRVVLADDHALFRAGVRRIWADL